MFNKNMVFLTLLEKMLTNYYRKIDISLTRNSAQKSRVGSGQKKMPSVPSRVGSGSDSIQPYA